jgi:hypothetical protein
MLGATAHRLHRGPHVAVARNQIPACGDEIAGFDLASDVDRLRNSLAAIGQNSCPRQVTVAFHHRMRPTQIKRLLGIERRVNSAEDYIRPPAARHLANLVTTQRIRGMNANPDRISGLNRVGMHLR